MGLLVCCFFSGFHSEKKDAFYAVIRLCISNAFNYFERYGKALRMGKKWIACAFHFSVDQWYFFFIRPTNKHILHLWFSVEYTAAQKKKTVTCNKILNLWKFMIWLVGFFAASFYVSMHLPWSFSAIYACNVCMPFGLTWTLCDGFGYRVANGKRTTKNARPMGVTVKKIAILFPLRIDRPLMWCEMLALNTPPMLVLSFILHCKFMHSTKRSFNCWLPKWMFAFAFVFAFGKKIRPLKMAKRKPNTRISNKCTFVQTI